MFARKKKDWVKKEEGNSTRKAGYKRVIDALSGLDSTDGDDRIYVNSHNKFKQVVIFLFFKSFDV